MSEDKKAQQYRTVNIKPKLWSYLAMVRSKHPELRGISDAIVFIIKENKELREKINSITQNETSNYPNQNQ